jgi:hypothetical protein
MTDYLRDFFVSVVVAGVILGKVVNDAVNLLTRIQVCVPLRHTFPRRAGGNTIRWLKPVRREPWLHAEPIVGVALLVLNSHRHGCLNELVVGNVETEGVLHAMLGTIGTPPLVPGDALRVVPQEGDDLLNEGDAFGGVSHLG